MIQSHQGLQPRLQILWLMIGIGGALLGARLIQLQIVENVEYKLAAERNRSQIIYQTAPRGRIYDKNGSPIATSMPAFSLIYMPGKRKEKVDLHPLAVELGKELKQDPEELYESLQQAMREETAIRLAENLPQNAMFRLSELKTLYPGVDLIVEARRYYPYGRFAAHLVGYMGKMDARSWKVYKNKGYRQDARVGKLGLESIFENELRGRDGGIRMEVDAQGRLKRVLERVDWQPGSNIHLTIDAPTQKAAEEGLRASVTGRGAVVAVDPFTGGILAIASTPDFDPNALLSSDPEIVKKQVAELPEFNLAISGTYAPGSTFKPIVSAAALNEERMTPAESFFCPGYFELGKRTFLCWDHKGHKSVSFHVGLAKSCDVYYYRTGLKIGGALIERYARLFGLGQKTNIALRGERAGHMFGPAARAANRRSWYDGDTLNLSIGQGELLVTPLQMAMATAAIANRGTLWRPHFTSRIEFNDGRPEFKAKPEKAAALGLKDTTYNLLDEALAQVVTSGTARQAIIPGLETRGKTGTAQNAHGEDHAWFIAFANRAGQAPGIALAVIVENGGHGSDVAVPIARRVMMAAYRLEEKPKVPRELKPPLPGNPAVAPPVRTL